MVWQPTGLVPDVAFLDCFLPLSTYALTGFGVSPSTPKDTYYQHSMTSRASVRDAHWRTRVSKMRKSVTMTTNLAAVPALSRDGACSVL